MVDGLVVVDKAPGWTSHDVVAKCRGIFGQKRVGHAGTLDPGATGVLLVGLGRVTRLLRYPGALPKTYVGEVVLGTETSTLDDEGEVTATYDMSGVTLGDARAAAERFVGDIEQVPPMVSAVKVGGRRLHELARQGVEVERQPRRVTVHRLDVAAAGDGIYRMSVDCSSGTYVRTLAADIGAALGGGAHPAHLRRSGGHQRAARLPAARAGLRGHDWRLRRRPHRPPVAHRQGAVDGRRPRLRHRRRHLRPPPGHRRAPRVRTEAAHRPRSEARA